jgi:hypothetical protein
VPALHRGDTTEEGQAWGSRGGEIAPMTVSSRSTCRASQERPHQVVDVGRRFEAQFGAQRGSVALVLADGLGWIAGCPMIKQSHTAEG